ncbi:hypothetical protein BD560DRAFT_310857, partial [Blakeslea trispora]
MHSDVHASYTDSDTPVTEIHSRIYRSSRRPNAFLLDISRIGKQHPGVHACSVINIKQLHYLEAYIAKERDDNDLETNGVFFGKSKTKVYPCRASDVESTYIDLKLTNLPPLSRTEVLEGLKQSSKPFGQVVDVGIHTEPVSGIFLGTGYA